MFPQILVDEKDQDFLVFLWKKMDQGELEYYTNERHVFGAKCSPSVANHAVQVAACRYDMALVPLVLHYIYMDDFYWGHSNIPELVDQAKQLAAALQEAGFTFWKWASNSVEVLSHFDPAD